MYLAPLHLVQRGSIGPVPVPRKRLAARTRIGALLVARGALDPGALAKALALQAREDVPLGEILLAHGMVDECTFYDALAHQWNARIVDLDNDPPDRRLVDLIGVETCLRERFVPWRRVGAATVVVTSRPDDFARIRDLLPEALKPAMLAVCSERAVLDALEQTHSGRMIRQAETKVAERDSCRSWDGRSCRMWLLAALATVVAGLIAAPAVTFTLLTAVAILALVSNLGLRAAALATGAWKDIVPESRTPPEDGPATPLRLPVVSILVPLFHETAIAERLVKRLARLDYPRELLDICLVTEDSDTTTRATLDRTDLPRWLRTVTVPEGTLRTKPRALNYALGFCRGSIVGIYDAEDAPAPDQIHRVVRRFHERGPEVACLQGVLDFYNARTSWMARCFTLEYASWFRVVLPGIERLGFAIPLGGTTLFLRREAIEKVGGWDAHNVTEDADLGVRLARHGYRSELIATVTEEEANTRPLAWIRQRSRWIKGYAMTWRIHMRDPARLWRDLGPRRFWGVQLLFGGSLLQGILAPVLWSYWLIFFGLSHPLAGHLTTPWVLTLTAIFLSAYAVNLAVMLVATRGPKHKHLWKWAPTTDLYFPLATAASAKALVEMVTRPFYWDKTSHGLEDVIELLDAPGQIVAPPEWTEPHRPALAEPISGGIRTERP